MRANSPPNDNARQHEESQRHRAVESLHPVFQFTQSVSFDLAAIVGIRAGGFALAGVASCRGGAVNYPPPLGVRENGKQMLVPRTPPDFPVRMISEARGALPQGQPVPRISAHLPRS